MIDELVEQNKRYTADLKQRYKTMFDNLYKYLDSTITSDQIPDDQEIIFSNRCMSKEKLETKVKRESFKGNGNVTTNYWPLLFLAINYTTNEYGEGIKMAFADSLGSSDRQGINGAYCTLMINNAKNGRNIGRVEISKESFEHLLLCYLAVDKVLKQENFFESITWNNVPGIMYWD